MSWNSRKDNRFTNIILVLDVYKRQQHRIIQQILLQMNLPRRTENMQLYEFKETQERVILIGVQTGVGDDVEASLDELDELAQTAGAETVRCV